MFNELLKDYTGSNAQNNAIAWLEKRLAEYGFYESQDKVGFLKMTLSQRDDLEKKISSATKREFQTLYNENDYFTIEDYPYYSQLDNLRNPFTTCNSSSNAMLLKKMKPNALPSGSNADDVYVQRILNGEFGYANARNPSIYHDAHTRALKSYGLDTTWCVNKDSKRVKEQLAQNVPVVVNILHKGDFKHLHGGHVIVLVNYDKENKKYFIFDPYGEIDGLRGGYPKPGDDGRYWLSESTFNIRWQGGYRIVNSED